MAKPFIKKGIFRMPKTERSIPSSRKKELMLQAKHERIKQLNEFILRKIDEIDLEHFILKKAKELALKYSPEEASAHLAMDVHAKIIDALNLPESKARIIKGTWMLGFLISKGTEMPIKAESMTRALNQALYAVNTILNEQKTRKPKGIGRLYGWKHYCLSRLKELSELKPSTEVRASQTDLDIVSNVLGIFSARYMTKEQLDLIEIEHQIHNAVLEKLFSREH